MKNSKPKTNKKGKFFMIISLIEVAIAFFFIGCLIATDNVIFAYLSLPFGIAIFFTGYFVPGEVYPNPDIVSPTIFNQHK